MMKDKGFSLIELIVVIGILAVLSVLLIPSFMNSSFDSKNSLDESWGETIQASVETCFTDKNNWAKLNKTLNAADCQTDTVYYMTDTGKESETFEMQVLLQENAGNMSVVAVNIITGPDADEETYNTEKANLLTIIQNHINSTIDPYSVVGEEHQNSTLKILVSRTATDFKVKTKAIWSDQETTA